MAFSTSSTVAGLMETLTARASARFVIGMRLFNHVFTVASSSADTVRIPAYPAPSAVTSATAETASITDSAKTIALVTASPAQIADATIVSKKSLVGGTQVYQAYFDVLTNNVIAGADYNIAQQFNDFTDAGNVSAVASFAALRASRADLANVGFGGQMHGAFSEDQMDLILASVIGYQLTQTQEYANEGYVGRLVGIELVSLPDALMETDTTKVGAIWYKEHGLAFGYHAGEAVQGIEMGTGAPAPLVMLGDDGIDVASTKLSAMVLGLAAEISASGGVACKYALS